MIPPGTKLVDSKKRHGALVRANGAIMLGDKVGSIHRGGARLRGVQRLLARRDQEGPQADRRDPLRDGNGLTPIGHAAIASCFGTGTGTKIGQVVTCRFDWSSDAKTIRDMDLAAAVADLFCRHISDVAVGFPWLCRPRPPRHSLDLRALGRRFERQW